MLKRALAVALLLLAAVPLGAQNLSPAMSAAVRAYKLDGARATAIAKSLEELTAHMVAHPDAMKGLAASMKLPAEERIKQMDQDPVAAGILKANGLTGREYFVGLLALRAASWAAEGRTDGLAAMASPGNVALLKGNTTLAARFRKADGGR